MKWTLRKSKQILQKHLLYNPKDAINTIMNLQNSINKQVVLIQVDSKAQLKTWLNILIQNHLVRMY